ncbi:MAG: hypothetical protein WCH65_06735 [bacterium]
MYKKYLEENDLEALEEFKKYCKNDVRMTMLVFLYFMYFKKIFIEDSEFTFTIKDLIDKSQKEEKSTSHMIGQNMFE